MKVKGKVDEHDKEGRKEGRHQGYENCAQKLFKKKNAEKRWQEKHNRYAFRHMVEKVQFEERPWVTKELRCQEVALQPLEV